MFSLNPVAARIVELIDGGFDEVEIGYQISSACGVALDRVRADLREFLDRLSCHGILRENLCARK
jgi:hypothetical protein